VVEVLGIVLPGAISGMGTQEQCARGEVCCGSDIGPMLSPTSGGGALGVPKRTALCHKAAQSL
jgi:hypothetical protein